MSLLDEVYATPSRVKGVVQLLINERGQRLKRESVENLLSPDALQRNVEDGKPKRAMVRGVLSECIRLRLVQEVEESLQLDPSLSEMERDAGALGADLPRVLLERVLDVNNREDEQLAEALAWYLGQDVLAAPGTLAEFTAAATEQRVPDRLRLNDNQFRMLLYWSRFFGLANVFRTPKQDRLTPDPTACVRRMLPRVFDSDARRSLPAREFLSRVGTHCRLFESGDLRAMTDQYAPRRQPQHLSTTTSHALLRLKEEGVLRLTERSDADAVALVEERTTYSVAEITWLVASEAA